jgi:hypothetical protein
MIFFPARRKASAGYIISFLSDEKASALKYYFISCPWEDVCSDIFLFTARGKTYTRRYYFYVLPVERILPGGVIFFPAAGMAAARLSLSLRGSNSIRAGGAWVSVSLTSSRASEVSCVWPLYRSSSRGGALFNFSIFQVPTDSVFIKSLLSRIFSHRYMHTDGALSHFLSCANLLVHDWVLITLSVAEGRQKSFHC